MVLTSSYGATWLLTVLGSTVMPRPRPGLPSPAVPSSTVMPAPSSPSSSAVVTTSCRCGTLLIATGPSASSVAHRIGSTAFLAPEICTSPFSTAPPSTTIFCMVFPVGRPWPDAFHLEAGIWPAPCSSEHRRAEARPASAPGFFRRHRLQRQGVDLAAHPLAQRGVDQAVAGQRQLAAEGFGHHGGLEMHAIVAAAPRACAPGRPCSISWRMVSAFTCWASLDAQCAAALRDRAVVGSSARSALAGFSRMNRLELVN